MLIFYKAKLAFLSVPKTGTTAYQAALAPHADMVITDPPALKHAPVYRYNRFIRPMYEKVCGTELELMAVMREPISWLGSWYRYRQRPQMRGRKNATHDMSFDAFVQAHLQNPPPDFANVGRQSKFLEERPNGTGIMHLFAYEAQPAVQAFLQARLNVEFTLSQQNVSPVGDTSLTSETERRLRRKHADDFDLYQHALDRSSV